MGVTACSIKLVTQKTNGVLLPVTIFNLLKPDKKAASFIGYNSLLLGVLLFYSACFTPLPALAEDNTLQVFAQKSTVLDSNIIRVGISNDAMTQWEYPQAQLSCTGPFRIRDKTSGATVFSAGAHEVLTISVSMEGFTVQKKQADSLSAISAGGAIPSSMVNSALLNPNLPGSLVINSSSPGLDVLASNINTGVITNLNGSLWVEPLQPQDRLLITNITRRKETPAFRGSFEIVRGYSGSNKLTVVNVVSLEDYLKAVVPNELPMRYGLEAVKAQAVAARNYALHPREKPWKTFDICDSQLCQVYLGAQTETPGSNQAVDSTAGLIALYYGNPILALFSSSHGGYAENYSNAFSDPKTKVYPAPTIPYLVGGSDIPMGKPLDLSTEDGARAFWTSQSLPSYDVNSPYYRWHKSWTASALTSQINKGLLEVSSDSSTKPFVSPIFTKGQSIGTLKYLRVLQRGNSGKIMVLSIEGTNGRWVIQKEFLVRKVLQHEGRMLPSANVVFSHLTNPKKQLASIQADGGGFGHGVGLSQLGASWMHQHGYKFPEIIQHYYRGVSLGSIPVQVGNMPTPLPVMSRFLVTAPTGILWIEDQNTQFGDQQKQNAIKIQLNGKILTLRPNGTHSGIEIGAYLKPEQLNTLVLFPDETNPKRRMKAWIDLTLPKPSV
jgi:stage II sporulation protein D